MLYVNAKKQSSFLHVCCQTLHKGRDKQALCLMHASLPKDSRPAVSSRWLPWETTGLLDHSGQTKTQICKWKELLTNCKNFSTQWSWNKTHHPCPTMFLVGKEKYFYFNKLTSEKYFFTSGEMVAHPRHSSQDKVLLLCIERFHMSVTDNNSIVQDRQRAPNSDAIPFWLQNWLWGYTLKHMEARG